MKVSVIMPVYNTELYLQEAIESVLEQSLKDLELIIVDDASTDESMLIAERYAALDDRVVLERLPQNSGGAGKPRNIGIERARGEYIFFMDSDDIISENAMRDAVAAADETKSDLVLLKMERFGPGKLGVPQAPFGKSAKATDFIKSKAYTTLTPCKLHRRTLITENNLRFPVSYAVGEDQPFGLAAYLNANHVTILADEPYYYVRARGAGESRNTRHQPRTPENFLEKNLDALDVINHFMQSGARRNLLAERFVTGRAGLHRVLSEDFLALDSGTQDAILRRLMTAKTFYTTAVRNNAQFTRRHLLDALFSGDVGRMKEAFDTVNKKFIILEERRRFLRGPSLVVYGPFKPSTRITLNGRRVKFSFQRLTRNITIVNVQKRTDSRKLEFSSN